MGIVNLSHASILQVKWGEKMSLTKLRKTKTIADVEDMYVIGVRFVASTKICNLFVMLYPYNKKNKKNIAPLCIWKYRNCAKVIYICICISYSVWYNRRIISELSTSYSQLSFLNLSKLMNGFPSYILYYTSL